MNGIHDVGGMDGFGPVDTIDHDETFHHDWEGVTYASFTAGLGSGTFGIDEFRHTIEQLPPADYLTASYYDRWLRAMTRLFVEYNIIDGQALQDRTQAFARGDATVPERTDPELLGKLAAGVEEAYDPSGSTAQSEQEFAVGDCVRVRNHNPAGHTRCPGYLRHATGTISTYRGQQTLPDAAAHGKEVTAPLYNVTFDATEVWGERGDENVEIAADLWQPYLEPAES